MTIIDELYRNHIELLDHLRKSNEISLYNFVDDEFKKVLVVAVASYFEEEVKSIIIEFANKKSSNNPILVSFIKTKAVERKYHEYFDWKSENANKFFGLFGGAFSASAQIDVKNNKRLEDGIKAFIELGYTRNELVHENFAKITITSNKTAEEYYNLYVSGIYFISYLKGKLV